MNFESSLALNECSVCIQNTMNCLTEKNCHGDLLVMMSTFSDVKYPEKNEKGKVKKSYFFSISNHIQN